MPHHDGLPLVFQFPEEDTQPESQEHKALWDELELALREDAAPVPAPVPAHVALTAPPPIPVHLPAHAPARILTCAPVLVPVHMNVSAAPLPAPVPARVPVPPSAAWMAAVDRFLAPTPVASSRQLTRSEVQNILAFLEARPTSRSTPTTAQDAAVAVGQWPDDTQSTAEEPLPTARRPRRRRVI